MFIGHFLSGDMCFLEVICIFCLLLHVNDKLIVGSSCFSLELFCICMLTNCDFLTIDIKSL